MRYCRCLVLFLLVTFAGFCFSDEPDFSALPKHPRMFLTAQREAEIKELAKSDKFLERLISEFVKKADSAVNDSPSEYKIPDGKRLLSQSRRSVERTSALALAYRLTGKREYADAAITEMLTVCRFKDWNPSHYLDTAEMCCAVGIGYDWLYDVIPPAERDELRAAIVKHALSTALPLYEKQSWWTKVNHNWNEVCNSGLTVGALAIADEEPEIANKIVQFAIKSLPRGLSAYKPDGAYPEGPGYWAYGSTYSGIMLKALDDVFKSDFGLFSAAGLNVTGDYYMSVISPTYRNYNYADAGEGADPSPMMFALSRFYSRTDYAVWERTFLEKRNMYSRGWLSAFRVIWYDGGGNDAAFAKTPRAKCFSGVQDICTMRTAWNEPNAAFVGFKGGDNRANHGHLDIGSFVYEMNGERWAFDLGGDDYNMPGYFGTQRWDYFRLNNRSHNTLVIGDKIQNPSANCKIIEFDDKAEGFVARAVVDMTDAYKEQVRSARRTVILQNDSMLTVIDELDGISEPVRWGMMTAAKIEVNGKKAALTRNKKTLNVEMTSDEVEQFEITTASPLTEKENQNEGFTMLTATAKPLNGKVRLRVTLKP